MVPYFSDDWVTMYYGDVLVVTEALPSASVNCVVTLPPYWGLREYCPGSWGREATLDEYINRLVQLFREVRRVLRPDGVLFLNLGDSYVHSKASGPQGSRGQRATRTFSAEGAGGRTVAGLKNKDLMGLPWRVAFALQADGWWLRSDIVWEKPNAMPERALDRPACSHEFMFLLSKSERYWYDAAAVKEPSRTTAWPGIGPKHGTTQIHRSGYAPMQVHATRNLRNVWSIPTTPTSFAHYATFPSALVMPCVTAGCPEGGMVLDPFVGSGTTCMVARALGRHSIGIDLDTSSLDLALQHRILPA